MTEAFSDPRPLKRKYNPIEKEKKVFDYLSLKHEQGVDPISFHQIQSALNISSGALQATVNRSLKSDAEYRIYETTGISEKNKQFTRKFTIVPPNVETTPPFSNLQTILNQIQKLQTGELLEMGNLTILPLKIDKLTVQLLETIPKVDSSIGSLTDLFKNALSYYIQDKLSPEVKQIALSFLKNNEYDTKNAE